MKRVGKPVFFIVAIILLCFTYLSIFGFSTYYADKKTTYIKGVNDIRWGIDIRGGVDVTFTPPSDVKDVTDDQMTAATSRIKQRLVTLNITDSEVYTDYNQNRIIVRFPWKEDESNFKPEDAIKELGSTANLTFREGAEVDQTTGLPTGITETNVILNGEDVKNASVQVDPQSNKYVVALTLESSGAKKFSDATQKLYASNGTISIWMDDEMISAPTVNAHITDGNAVISGDFDADSAKALADKINGGALPFALVTENVLTINPTMGLGARDAMALAGIIAFILIAILMIVLYKLPGVIAVIALTGHIGATLAAISGFFGSFPSFTLTLPGIAGIVLSIGMGVDCNVIQFERIKEELRLGKSIEGAIDAGYKRGSVAVIDGNMTVLITAVILMGSFGPPSNIFAKLLTPFFSWFGPSTAGAIYSFGYTLIIGVILNFIMGVFASKLMLKSISKFKCFRNPSLYGGKKNA